jgi:hypothetical protein
MQTSRYNLVVMTIAMLSVFFAEASAQPITIAAARALPSNATNITVEGVITRARGRIVYIQDSTAGIPIFRNVASFIAVSYTHLTLPTKA